jgi:hypothetical protein
MLDFLRKNRPKSELRETGVTSASLNVLRIMIFADLTFVLLYLISAFLWLNYEIKIHHFLYFNTMNSLASNWGYAKYGFAVALFYAVYRYSGRVGYIYILGVLLLLLLDDAAELHDRIGRFIAPYLEFGPLTEMVGQNRGEPFVYLAMAIIIFTSIYLAYDSLKVSERQPFINFTWAILLLAFFGAGLDVLHGLLSTFTNLPALGEIAATALEDGGELVAVSLLVFAGLDRLLKQATGT